MATLFGGGFRRKVFLSYHHGGDQAYYEAFSRTFHDSLEAITDNSLGPIDIQMMARRKWWIFVILETRHVTRFNAAYLKYVSTGSAKSRHLQPVRTECRLVLERAIDSENVDYVMRRIRDSYITGTSCTIVLVGAGTWGRKYIDWEIKATLEKGHGLMGVHLPTLQSDFNGKVTVPERLHDNIISGYAVWTRWADIASSDANCRDLIERANSRDRTLIRNARERRLRNAS